MKMHRWGRSYSLEFSKEARTAMMVDVVWVLLRDAVVSNAAVSSM